MLEELELVVEVVDRSDALTLVEAPPCTWCQYRHP
jgi:hypothetical protein